MKKLLFISFLIIIAFLGCEEEPETWQVSLVNGSDSVTAALTIGGMLLGTEPGETDACILEENSYNWELVMVYADSSVYENGSFVLDKNATCYIYYDFIYYWEFGE